MRFFALSLLAFVPLTAFAEGWNWHNAVSRYGAMRAPSPFKEHPEICGHGGYPLELGDENLVRGHERWAHWLWTREAVEALKRGDAIKACFLAGVATHYLVKSCLLAEARVWDNEFEVISRLPPRYWDVKPPVEKRDEEGPFFLGPPPDYKRELFEGAEGNLRRFFAALREEPLEGFDPESIPPTEGWSLYDGLYFAAWAREILALETLDLDKVRNGRPRFKAGEALKALRIAEARLASWVCALHFAYVAEAGEAEVRNLGPLGEGLKKFVASGRPRVLFPRGAPWPVRRAARLLALELRRTCKRIGREAPIVRRIVSSEGAGLPLTEKLTVMVVGNAKESKFARAQKLTIPKGRRGLIAVVESPQGFPKGVEWAVFILGREDEDVPHMVDLFLDLARAPLCGPHPASASLKALREVWAGWKLLQALKERSGEEAVKFALSVPFKQARGDEEKFLRLVEGRVEGGESIGEWWDAMLSVPLPSGESADDFVQRWFLGGGRG